MSKKQTKIGGQALIEGVMMRGSGACVLAVRDQDGDIITDFSRVTAKKGIKNIPIIRGVFAFFSSLVLGASTIMKSAQMAYGEEEQPSKFSSGLSVFLALVFAIGVFFFIPSILGNLFHDNIVKNVLAKNLFSGAIRIILFLSYLFLVSLLKDMRRVFMYHGAEHKTINCYEHGYDLTIENIKKCSTRHNRCGTTFMFFVMIVSIIVFAFVDYALYNIFNFDNLNGYVKNLIFMAIKFTFLPIVAGISYELLFFLAKMPDNLFVKALRAPGLGLQRLTTFEPDESMIEVALVAFNGVLKMEEDLSIPPRPYTKVTILECYDECDKVLSKLNAEDAEADWLLCHILSCSRSDLKGIKHLSLKDYKKLKELLKLRETQPLDYCLEKSSFCGYDIIVNNDVLIPRFETEILAITAVEYINQLKIDNVLELCTGSGCISLVLSKQTNAQITALDICSKALDVAKKNLVNERVKLIQSDLFSALNDEKFDLIVANPPYIKSCEIESLQFEVRCQPNLALDGGDDGLNFYRKIAIKAKDYLTNSGTIMLEIGKGQQDEVIKMLLENGFKSSQTIKDFSGIERIVVASLSPLEM